MNLAPYGELAEDDQGNERISVDAGGVAASAGGRARSEGSLDGGEGSGACAGAPDPLLAIDLQAADAYVAQTVMSARLLHQVACRPSCCTRRTMLGHPTFNTLHPIGYSRHARPGTLYPGP